jgi:hypothetical protein
MVSTGSLVSPIIPVDLGAFSVPKTVLKHGIIAKRM